MMYFKKSEFFKNYPDYIQENFKFSKEFLFTINYLRQLSGFPAIVTSGYRSKLYNDYIYMKRHKEIFEEFKEKFNGFNHELILKKIIKM